MTPTQLTEGFYLVRLPNPADESDHWEPAGWIKGQWLMLGLDINGPSPEPLEIGPQILLPSPQPMSPVNEPEQIDFSQVMTALQMRVWIAQLNYQQSQLTSFGLREEHQGLIEDIEQFLDDLSKEHQ